MTDVRGEDVLFEKSGKWGRRVTVTLSFHGLTMDAGYWKPRDAAGPLPAVLAMEPVWWEDPFIKNGIIDRVIARGFILAGFDHNDLASFEDPKHHPAQDAYPECDWGVVAVGAWGYRVAMNWLGAPLYAIWFCSDETTFPESHRSPFSASTSSCRDSDLVSRLHLPALTRIQHPTQLSRGLAASIPTGSARYSHRNPTGVTAATAQISKLNMALFSNFPAL